MTSQPSFVPSIRVAALSASLCALVAASAQAQSATVSPPAPQPSAADRALAVKVLRETPLIDGHNDLPWRIREDTVRPSDVPAYDLAKHTAGMTDLGRLKTGMLGAQFWSVYIPGETSSPLYKPNGAVSSEPGYARVQLEQIDIARRTIAAYPDRLEWATTAADVRRAFKDGKVGSMLGMEGGHAIENSLGALRAYYDLGVRYMTLTHNVTLDWADAALDSARHGGLTPFGKEVVREMNRLGMLVDISHVSPGTMSDALTVSEAPVIFSHSGARALVDHRRNVPDSILSRVPKNGGIVMVPFVTDFVSKAAFERDEAAAAQRAALKTQFPADSAARQRAMKEWTTAHPAPPVMLADVADHIDHVRKVAGVDHVGIGSDFDGITDTVVGLEDVSKYPDLFAELARRGWTEADLRKLAGENLLRVMTQAEAVAARLQRERPASTATIEELDHTAPHS
jgi:membrane dipeptidase